LRSALEKIDNEDVLSKDEKTHTEKGRSHLRIARTEDLPTLEDLQPQHFDFIYNIDDLIIRQVSDANVSEEE